MAALHPFFTKSICIFLFLLHLGCFVLPFSTDRTPPIPRKRRKSFDSPDSHKAFSSSWSFLKQIFSPKKRSSSHTTPPTPTLSSGGQPSSIPIPLPPATENLIPDPLRKRRVGSRPGSDALLDCLSFPGPHDFFPCPACGEVFPSTQLMEQHQFTRHAVSDLHDGDSGKNIVRIIFKSGWIDPERAPRVHRILKIHHSPRTLSRFEEYRESVKSKADEGGNGAVQVRDERCVADGNELLRFYCTTFACSLGQNGNFGVCNQGFCSVCGIIKAGFSPKLDGISTLSTSWRAHLAVPGDVEADFAFMNVKRAMLVCRVIAGRVGCDQMAVAVVVDKEDPGFDSVLAAGQSREGGGAGSTSDGDELLVFNPRAVLPCFVVVYSVV